MAKIIAIANQKGGTGKTTTSTCLAGALQLLGKKVLLVDCDAQCNATDTYGAQTEDVCTLFDVMTRQGTVEEGIQHCEAGDILPSDNALKDIDEQLVRDMGKNFRLREALESVSEQYDYIVLDTTTINAPVVITIGTGTTAYPLTDCNCAQATAESIHTRTRYATRVATSATGTATFKYLGRFCRSHAGAPASIS